MLISFFLFNTFSVVPFDETYFIYVGLDFRFLFQVIVWNPNAFTRWNVDIFKEIIQNNVRLPNASLLR